ncbi:MAG: hypothetical protein C0470_10610 [Verminephrobacter sp.]|nr:hypothetical protein [Verminephrobacter sp.]
MTPWSSTRLWRFEPHPPEALRAFPLLSNCCAIREGRRRQRGGAALARRPLACIAPVSCAALMAVRMKL